ncbi:MAG: DUF1800 domain-containing protein, partial [Alphaproteobacteria bacterium]|nr:DUF1800 domain-containing protein [Alphaproteobacteria bacterium]
NTTANRFLGIDLRPLQPTPNGASAIEQGRKVIQLAAEHNRTAEFIVGKLARRIFGEKPSSTLVTAAIKAWNDNKESPYQIREVMRVFLSSDEIRTASRSKLRRPYERAIAFARTTNSQMRPHRQMLTAFAGTRDFVYQWPSPEGWPDVSDYWLNTSSLMSQWNFLLSAATSGPIGANITAETPRTTSVTAVVDHWIGRMVGYQLSSAGYTSLTDFAGSSAGIRAFVGQGTASATTIENELRRLVALIAVSPEFSYR